MGSGHREGRAPGSREAGEEGRRWLRSPGPQASSPIPTRWDPLQLLSPPPSTDCYVDLRGSPAPLPSTPTMPLFPHVLDLLAPLDSSSRALPGTESLDDFSDGDVFGPELDTLLDSLVSGAVPSCSRNPSPPSPLGPHHSLISQVRWREGPAFVSQWED